MGQSTQLYTLVISYILGIIQCSCQLLYYINVEVDRRIQPVSTLGREPGPAKVLTTLCRSMPEAYS